MGIAVLWFSYQGNNCGGVVTMGTAVLVWRWCGYQGNSCGGGGVTRGTAVVEVVWLPRERL